MCLSLASLGGHCCRKMVDILLELTYLGRELKFYPIILIMKENKNPLLMTSAQTEEEAVLKRRSINMSGF